jgi:hypothetical protein
MPGGAAPIRGLGGRSRACRPRQSGPESGCASDARSAEGGTSAFVASCAPAFDQRRCRCLADAGRMAISDTHRRRYARAIIKEVIGRNPVIGLQIAVTCGISSD